MHFVYVFSKDDKERLLAAGFELIKADESNGMWAFRNQESIACFDDLRCVVSDVLTF